MASSPSLDMRKAREEAAEGKKHHLLPEGLDPHKVLHSIGLYCTSPSHNAPLFMH
jgi:hypothetical protein